MLVWTAKMGIEVEDLNAAAAQLDSQMADLGGYVEERGDYGSQRRRFVFRVPSAAFETALNTLEQTGEVRSREVKGVDVTEQYVDLETRLANNRALRDRLRELLDCEDLGRARPYLPDGDLRRLFWNNLIAARGPAEEARLCWRCEVVRKAGWQVLESC